MRFGLLDSIVISVGPVTEGERVGTIRRRMRIVGPQPVRRMDVVETRAARIFGRSPSGRSTESVQWSGDVYGI